jgi:hypothetical protein
MFPAKTLDEKYPKHQDMDDVQMNDEIEKRNPAENSQYAADSPLSSSGLPQQEKRETHKQQGKEQGYGVFCNIDKGKDCKQAVFLYRPGSRISI